MENRAHLYEWKFLMAGGEGATPLAAAQLPLTGARSVSGAARSLFSPGSGPTNQPAQAILSNSAAQPPTPPNPDLGTEGPGAEPRPELPKRLPQRRRKKQRQWSRQWKKRRPTKKKQPKKKPPRNVPRSNGATMTRPRRAGTTFSDVSTVFHVRSDCTAWLRSDWRRS